ncbi:MAG: hypothetical protein ACRCSP_04380, partial [Rhodoglobus sp.]
LSDTAAPEASDFSTADTHATPPDYRPTLRLLAPAWPARQASRARIAGAGGHIDSAGELPALA